ncbi:HNH endonuclease signature motif containing protein [Parafrankia discariae]|uniref:HNH endonuclease signature motif containing protein n=1 Tax=Parafrankia discariae TaxID=365528 RepID=UPI00035C1C34|nr:HNH endonuclease signature motif containing protein [Parafrankia discariae]
MTHGARLTREACDTKASELFGEISRVVHTIAAGHADLLTLLAQFAALRLSPDTEHPPGADAFAPEEIAAAMAISPQSASAQLAFARTVTRRLPNAVHALRAGVLDLQRLRSLEKAVHPLDDRTAATVETQVLAGGARTNRRAFADVCKRTVTRIDPEGSADRAQTRRKDRRVRISPDDDGTSTLAAVLPAEDAEACYQRINQTARSLGDNRPEGDDRTDDQIRADVLVDLLTGRVSHATPTPCDIQVVVPVTTLMGLSNDPGEIPGHGPIPARIAREIADRPGSTWRRILTDPQGHLIEVADRRLPSPAQIRHVRARNQTCVFTGCTRPSRRTETDHTVPFSQGGPTLTKNLGPLCPRHHRMKHLGHWRITQPHEGTFMWFSPLGRTSTTKPHTYLETDISTRAEKDPG